MEKKTYSKPVMVVEMFVPQSYCATCFSYTASLACRYGLGVTPTEDGYDHGEPCANSTIEVTINNGVVTMVGHEGGDKTEVHLTSVNIPGITDVHQVGDQLENCYWESTYGGLLYKHRGNGVVNTWSMTKEGHPNHS